MRTFRIKYIFIALLSLIALDCGSAVAQSVRAERRLINEGNKLYNERKFAEAAKKYESAIGVNSSSAVGHYNLGLAQIKQVTNPQDTTPKSKSLLDNARKNLSSVAAMAKEKPGLASKANYNLGNLEYNQKEYKNAIEYYKQALRIDPSDNSARKNLRIAQKQMQNQDQNKDQNQDQNKDQQQNQDKNQDQNKDQNKDQNQQQQQNQPDINQQTADQILKAMENKENQTRARVTTGNQGDKSTDRNRSRKNW